MLENEYELYYFSESVKDGILSFDYKLKRGVADHNRRLPFRLMVSA